MKFDRRVFVSTLVAPLVAKFTRNRNSQPAKPENTVMATAYMHKGHTFYKIDSRTPLEVFVGQRVADHYDASFQRALQAHLMNNPQMDKS